MTIKTETDRDRLIDRQVKSTSLLAPPIGWCTALTGNKTLSYPLLHRNHTLFSTTLEMFVNYIKSGNEADSIVRKLYLVNVVQL